MKEVLRIKLYLSTLLLQMKVVLFLLKILPGKNIKNEILLYYH